MTDRQSDEPRFNPLRGSPDTRFEALNGLTFAASELTRAIGITSDDLTNYLSKNRIQLASQSAGPGRARAFCLVDVYQIALLRRLSDMTKRPEWSARALEQLFFSIPLGGASDEPCYHVGLPAAAHDNSAMERVRLYRNSCCQSAKNSLRFYSDRDADQPWFLLVSPDDVKKKDPIIDLVQLNGPSGKFSMWSGLFINTTLMLTAIDSNLYKILSEAGDQRLLPNRVATRVAEMPQRERDAEFREV